MDRGGILLAARRRKRMSQGHLASVSGVSVRTIRRAETGLDVSGETLRCLCAVLDVDAETLPQDTAPGLPLKAENETPSMVGPENRPAQFPGPALYVVLALLAVAAAPMVTTVSMLVRHLPPSAGVYWLVVAQCAVMFPAVELDKRVGLASTSVLLGFAQVFGGVFALITFGSGMATILQVVEILVIVAGTVMMALGIREHHRIERGSSFAMT